MADDIDARPPVSQLEPQKAERLGTNNALVDRNKKGGLYHYLRNEFEQGENSYYDPDYRFLNLLDRTISRTGFVTPQNRPMTILDLACGNCNEGFGIKAFFAGETASYDDVRIFGVDQDEYSIRKARENITRFESKFFGSTIPSIPSYDFIEGDATDLSGISEAPSQADVVLIRNQFSTDPDASEQTWEEMFSQGYSRLSDNGIMIITSRSEVEHANALEKLRKLNPEIILDEENPYSKVDYQDEEIVTGNDRHIVILRKRKKEDN